MKESSPWEWFCDQSLVTYGLKHFTSNIGNRYVQCKCYRQIYLVFMGSIPSSLTHTTLPRAS